MVISANQPVLCVVEFELKVQKHLVKPYKYSGFNILLYWPLKIEFYKVVKTGVEFHVEIRGKTSENMP